jgi:hypothetical protein
MHFIHHTKVNDDMEFHYYKIFKVLVIKTTRLCNQMALATEWVKRHGFSNSLITSRICLS